MNVGTGQQSAASREAHDWPIGPREPSLGERDVHVWRAELARAGDDLLALLNDEERKRAERIVGAEQRARWMHSRGVLRALLGRYLGCDPGTVELDVGTYGKPELGGAGHSPGSLSFSLSHSAGLALYAFTTSGSVGVDVEELTGSANPGGPARRARDDVAVAKRVFGEEQALRLAAIAPPKREREFLRLWTAYEAELKRRGRGIGAGGVAPAQPRWVAELPVGPAAAAALACHAEPGGLRCWSWN
jgi:4'-phosphopantetheinyl transferase